MAAGINPYHTLGGSSHIGSNTGLLFYVEGFNFAPHVESRGGVCYYLDRKPPGGRYAPGCLDAEAGLGDNVTAPAPEYHQLSYQGALTHRPASGTSAPTGWASAASPASA